MMATITLMENYNVHPINGGLIYYRYVKGENTMMVSLDNKQTWLEVEIKTTIYNESDFARFIYGFKAGLGIGIKLK